MAKEAILYEKADGKKVYCRLCAHRCIIHPGGNGLCGVRHNTNGKLFTRAYKETAAQNIDPVEKKPLFHFFPGSEAFSVACAGCNFRCGFCQNWQISQIKEVQLPDMTGNKITPEEIVQQAASCGCRSIAYTYTEPVIFFEYAYDTAMAAKDKGICNIFVTNGYMTGEALSVIRPYLDAANIDLKSFNDTTYRKVCGGKLDPVLSCIENMRKCGIWIEITTLIVPGMNDSRQELKDIASFISGTGKEIPWHISVFHPAYKMGDIPPTSEEKLREAYDIGREAGLYYIYMGNIPGEQTTLCYNCGDALIKRTVFIVTENNIIDSRCPRCGAKAHGIGM